MAATMRPDGGDPLPERPRGQHAQGARAGTSATAARWTRRRTVTATGGLTIGDGYYEGAFADGEIQGEGVRVWSDGSSFTGTFVHGEPSGPGVWVGANGARYEGEFQGYTRHGEGTLQLANGDKYVGTF
eukprot:jgi/Tetstr1/458604/TSEL_045007.t1